jgi:hypothetical protein
MDEVTLESLARRVEALERALGLRPGGPAKQDWRNAIGMFAGNEFQKQVDEEGRKIREAERAAAQRDEAE